MTEDHRKVEIYDNEMEKTRISLEEKANAQDQRIQELLSENQKHVNQNLSTAKTIEDMRYKLKTLEKQNRNSFLSDLKDKIKDIQNDSALLSASHQREAAL